MPNESSDLNGYLLVSGCCVVERERRLENKRIEHSPGLLDTGPVSAEDVNLRDQFEQGYEAITGNFVVVVLHECAGPAVPHRSGVIAVELSWFAQSVKEVHIILGHLVTEVDGLLHIPVDVVGSLKNVRNVVVIERAEPLIFTDTASALDNSLVIELTSHRVIQTNETVAKVFLKHVTMMVDKIAGGASHIATMYGLQ